MAKRFWDPRKSQLGELPNTLLVSQDAPGIMACPHWHAQVEVNFLYRGAVEYRMHGHTVRLAAGDLALFWGGQPLPARFDPARVLLFGADEKRIR